LFRRHFARTKNSRLQAARQSQRRIGGTCRLVRRPNRSRSDRPRRARTQRPRPGSMKNNGHPVFGILEWLRPGEEERVERLLTDLKTIGAKDVRTGISWADWHTQGGEQWYAW